MTPKDGKQHLEGVAAEIQELAAIAAKIDAKVATDGISHAAAAARVLYARRTGAASIADRMTELCLSIPCLRGLRARDATGIIPWDPVALCRRYGTASSGERSAIAFVLHVWNSHPLAWASLGVPAWTVDDFSRLDAANRAAVASWFAAPFWP